MPKLTQDQNRESSKMQISGLLNSCSQPQFTPSPLRLSAPVLNQSPVLPMLSNLAMTNLSNS